MFFTELLCNEACFSTFRRSISFSHDLGLLGVHKHNTPAATQLKKLWSFRVKQNSQKNKINPFFPEIKSNNRKTLINVELTDTPL